MDVYPDHVFLVLQSPQAGTAGHVHTIELDQFIGDRYLVTVHGPLSAAADPAAAQVEVDALAKRLASGKLCPQHGYELTYALATAVAKRLRDFTARLTADMWNLEYRFQEMVKQGPSGHLRGSGTVPGRVVPSAPRSDGGQDAGRDVARGVRPDVQDQGIRRGQRAEADR
jgi:hypothetical protein